LKHGRADGAPYLTNTNMLSKNMVSQMNQSMDVYMRACGNAKNKVTPLQYA